jgi:hypothetical protein
MRRELRNAVINHDILEALRKVATPAEWRALQQVEIVTAAAYLARNRRDGAASWCREVLAAPNREVLPRLRAGSSADRRTRVWYGVPLEDFVGRLADERRRCAVHRRSGGPRRSEAVRPTASCGNHHDHHGYQLLH